MLKTIERYALYVAHSITSEMEYTEILNRRNFSGENLGVYLHTLHYKHFKNGYLAESGYKLQHE